MKITRRSFVVRSSSVAGAIAAWRLGDLTVWAQTPPPAPNVPKRQTLKGMALNDPIISAWREGVQKLKNLPASDPFNWNNLAGIHGTAAGFNKCPHGNWYFLPWHRGYLTMYERKIREVTSFADFALPYWDWTAEPTVPPAYSAPTYNNAPNPLYTTRTLTGALSSTIIGQQILNSILTKTPYESFGTSRPAGQNSTDQSWIGRGTGVQGLLEGTPHNLVHNNLGGLMASSQSALDPIFMMHHCNIDRIWALWNAAGFADEPDPLWTGMTFMNHFMNKDGSSWSPKVTDLLTPERQLGYTYGLPVPVSPIALQAQWANNFKRMFSVQANEPAPGLEKTIVSVTGTATAAQPLITPVKIKATSLRQVTSIGAFASGEEFLALARPSATPFSTPKVVTVIRNIALSQQADTEFRVYLNATPLNASTPTADPSYVGSFGFFGGPHLGHADDKPSVLLDLTATIRTLYRTEAATPDTVNIQIVPVPIPRGALTPEAGSAKPESIEVSIISA